MAAGLAPGNPANEPDKKPVKHHSKFKPNMSHYYGALFGMLTPSYAAQAVPDDKGFTIRAASDIDTFSLKAPMMTPVRHRKDYFYVPKKAILPLNADLYVTNPLTGEDIVPETVNTVIPRHVFYKYLDMFTKGAQSVVYNNGSGAAGAGTYTPLHIVFAILQLYEMGEMFFSTGSLLHRCGISTYNTFVGPFLKSLQRRMTFDEVIDYAIGYINSRVQSMTVSVDSLKELKAGNAFQQVFDTVTRTQYTVDFDLKTAGFSRGSTISLRQLLDLMRENHLACITSITLRDGFTDPDLSYIPAPDDAEDISVQNWLTFQVLYPDTDIESDNNWINLERIISYQLACAQWFTNDAVDAVYTTALWHQLMCALCDVGAASAYSAWNADYRNFNNDSAYVAMYKPKSDYFGSRRYYLNDMVQEYDSVSGWSLTNMFVALGKIWNFPIPTFPVSGSTINFGWSYTVQPGTVPTPYAALWYCKNLFNMQRSLRYKDYLVGARLRPLAVGDVDVQVNNNLVNVVDITKNIMMQKFLNQVNRIHRTLKEYSRGIFGASPMFDPKEVMFIGSTEEVIGAEETNNTGAAQVSEPQSITSHLRSNSSRFAFVFDAPEFGIIIGITSFDVARPYVTVTDRECMHVDRFDDFNPYMQHIGDQAILGGEVDPMSDNNFAYQLRYAEYKQRLDRASGPFAGNYLPGYALVAEPQTLLKPGATEPALDSDFIRARAYEFDQFYLALTNWSPAGYFHFIIRDDYDVTIDRPMEAAPSIL